jgi:hypothetical protein
MSDNLDVRPRFFMEAVQDDLATAKEGRPIFNNAEFVEILIPGDRLSRPVFPVEDKHRERWPEAYAAFKRGQDHAITGTPLEAWPVMTTARVMELKAINIMSVEDLAGLPDRAIGQLGPDGRKLREQAQAYLDAAKGGATVAAQAKEIAALREQVERLMSSMNAPAPAPGEEATFERAINDLSDDELKAFIERETGEKPHHKTGRDTLLRRAAEIATADESEAA